MILEVQTPETLLSMAEEALDRIRYTKSEEIPLAIERAQEAVAIIENIAILPAPKWELKSKGWTHTEVRGIADSCCADARRYIGRASRLHDEGQVKFLTAWGKSYLIEECRQVLPIIFDSAYEEFKRRTCKTKAEVIKAKNNAVEHYHFMYSDGGLGYPDKIYFRDDLEKICC